jgi:hypothetical protein
MDGMIEIVLFSRGGVIQFINFDIVLQEEEVKEVEAALSLLRNTWLHACSDCLLLIKLGFRA